MKEDFYTLGGGHFWEDVFFYQKWRIQRNYTTKKCRLLDNWDIRRFEGSFEDCRRAFIKYIDAFQLARQKGHMIIMIHSIGQSKNIFRPLWREALNRGFMAAAINFPSSQKNLTGHIKQFNFFLNHLEDVNEVSFVTYGAGNAILQALLAGKAEWQKHLKIRRAVEISPYVRGSKLLKTLSSNGIGNFIIGPMGKDLAPEKMKKLPQISGTELGIIRSNKPFVEQMLELITVTRMPDIDDVEVQRLTNAKEVITINDHHLNIFNNRQICKKTINFIKTGKFGK